MTELSASGLADLAGVTEPEVARLVELGLLVPRDGAGPFRETDVPGPVAPPTPPGDQPAGRAARRSRHALWLIQLHAIEG